MLGPGKSRQTFSLLWRTTSNSSGAHLPESFVQPLGRLLTAWPRPRDDRLPPIDLWDSTGEKMVEYLASVEDFELAMTTFRAACEQRWPGANITLQAGANVIEDSRRAAVAGGDCR